MHDYFRFANLQFVAFTTHGFNQDGQVQFATAGNFECIGAFSFFHAHGNVGFDFFKQAVTQMTAGYIIAFFASKGAVVYRENHGQGRFVNFKTLQRFRIFVVSNGFANVSVSQANQSNDIACTNFVSFYTFQTLIGVETTNFCFTATVFVAQSNIFAIVNGTANNATYNDTTNIGIPVQSVNQHLKRSFYVNVGSRNVFHNYFEEGFKVVAFFFHGKLSDTVTSGSENNGEFQLVFVSVQLDEKVKYFVDNFVYTLVRTVNFIDYNDGFQMLFQCFTQYIFGLRHRTFVGVYQKQYAVNHGQYAFNFATKVSMARSIKNVDFGIAVHNGGVLGQNGNATFTFQIVGVHYTVFNVFIATEDAALF